METNGEFRKVLERLATGHNQESPRMLRGRVELATLELLQLSQGDLERALTAVVVEAVRITSQRNEIRTELLELIQELRALQKSMNRSAGVFQIFSRPMLVGSEESLGGEDCTMRAVYAKVPGTTKTILLEIPDEVEPELLCYCFAAEDKRWLGPAQPPPTGQHEYEAVAAHESAETYPDLGEVTIRDTMERCSRRFCSKELVAEVQQKLEDGHTVTVLGDREVATKVVKSAPPAVPDCVEMIEAESPRFDRLILQKKVKTRFHRVLDRLVEGKACRVLAVGPTGNGKSMACKALLVEARHITNKPTAKITLSAATTGSKYVDEAQGNIRRAILHARHLAANDHLVLVDIPEIDGLVGAAGNRTEGTHDRSVRTTIQEFLSEDIPGVIVFASMNRTESSYLPDSIERRFLKIEVPRTTRKQLALVIAQNVDAELIHEHLGLTPAEFGSRVADSLNFAVARCHLHSGNVFNVLARDVSQTCNAKLKALTEEFCEDLSGGHATSFYDMLDRVHEEFSNVDLNKHNLFDATFLKREKFVHDPIKLVERV